MHGAEPTNNGLGLRRPSATGLVVVNQLIWWGRPAWWSVWLSACCYRLRRGRSSCPVLGKESATAVLATAFWAVEQAKISWVNDFM